MGLFAKKTESGRNFFYVAGFGHRSHRRHFSAWKGRFLLPLRRLSRQKGRQMPSGELPTARQIACKTGAKPRAI